MLKIDESLLDESMILKKYLVSSLIEYYEKSEEKQEKGLLVTANALLYFLAEFICEVIDDNEECFLQKRLDCARDFSKKLSQIILHVSSSVKQ